MLLSLFLLFSFNNIFAQESVSPAEQTAQEQNKNNNLFLFKITTKEAALFIKGEYDRSNLYYGEISITGAVEFNNLINIKGGFAIGKSALCAESNAFLNSRYAPFNFNYLTPLGFSVSYIYNGLPDFKTHIHSIIPAISYNTWRFGLSLGVNLRFSSFFAEEPEFESIFSFHSYFNFISADKLIIGAGFGNFSDFHAKNIGAYSLKLNVDILINRNWSVLNVIELMQSGGDGLTTTFYGLSWKGGAKFSW